MDDNNGCGAIVDAALQTIDEDGYLSTEEYYCRWGQGGTYWEEIDGKQYTQGVCFDKNSEQDSWFRGRKIEASDGGEGEENPQTQPPGPPSNVYAGDRYKPRGKWCPTQRLCFSNIKWKSYTNSKAVGFGKAKDCPGGALGKCRTYKKLKVSLSKPEWMCGQYHFSRLKMLGKTYKPGAEPLCQVYYSG